MSWWIIGEQKFLQHVIWNEMTFLCPLDSRMRFATVALECTQVQYSAVRVVMWLLGFISFLL